MDPGLDPAAEEEYVPESHREEKAKPRRKWGETRPRAKEAESPKTGPGGLLKITGLWEGETKAGRRMISGTIRSGLKLVILENEDAEGNQPQWVAFYAGAGDVADAPADSEF